MTDELRSKDELFFENETRKHQQEVARYLTKFAQMLLTRAMEHDASKLESPEREIFIEFTPKLKGSTYGSEEYKTFLAQMKPALDHHYAKNKHHPEFNDINGYTFQTGNNCAINAMDLVDIVEMLCDWMAAVKRHTNGSIWKSIDHNEKRFGINEQLSQLFRNTAALLEETI
ncbi:MAG: hypothetical protein BWY42_00940 [Candidatus Omnitrophica bacterium ADurb.Bin277]|nr:MAG: hypothetical protein BWY42_00940 [Candidatus Omnitrophica bacterium ADurb.Bin277]